MNFALKKHDLLHENCVEKNDLVDVNIEILNVIDDYVEILDDDRKIEYEKYLFHDNDHDLASFLDKFALNEDLELNKNCEKIHRLKFCG